ncbi:putative cupin domain protein [Diaporthe ampelina]|uniref:Putative cupin domain protein n=1 Tax=Diaporthe ampelina TaxID=1214573 RepID=A0A0G2FBN3_9PEZI|nr:putative cupin domain protein [Diaporthe ampelina]
MAQSQVQEAPDLSTPSRFITDHDANGLSVFNTSIPDLLPTQIVGDRSKFHLGYVTDKIPADLAGGSDIATYSSFLSTPPGIFLPGGSVLRIIDMKPAGESIMHRTQSLDYGIVLDGEIELVLDSGESRTLKRSDVAIQRGTNHLWRNKSKTEWGRMLFVTLEAKPIEVNGKVLGGIEGHGVANAAPSGN